MRTRTFLSGLLAACFLLSGGSGAEAPAPPKPLKVVTTIPDLADIVRQVGGERVEVSSIARGTENLHAVVARPSHLVALSRADLFVEVGLSLEVAFIPGLLENARNRKIQPGAPGFVNVSEGWQAIDVPVSISRKAGDVHPGGNPHMNIAPQAGRHIATKIFEGLVRVDPDSKSDYEQRLGAYTKKLDDAEARWSSMGNAWQGQKVVVYHLEYNYLAEAYGIEVVGAIELKPGIPATPNHLAELIGAMKASGCKTILTAPWSNDDDVERVAEATGARVVELPNQCGGMKGAETWISMMDLVHERLAAAFGGGPEPK